MSRKHIAAFGVTLGCAILFVLLLAWALVAEAQFPFGYQDISHRFKLKSYNAAGYRIVPQIDGPESHIAFYPAVALQPLGMTTGSGLEVDLPGGETNVIYVTFDDGSRSAVTQIEFDGDKLVGDITHWFSPGGPRADYPNLATLDMDTNAGLVGDISGWTNLPSSYLNLYSTGVSGDISGWTNLPSTRLLLHYTSVTGDISGWTSMPSAYLYLYNTSVTGDISGWTWPASLDYLYIQNTSLGYSSTNGFFSGCDADLVKADFDDCSLTETEVDYVLVDCDISGAGTNALDIAGTGGTANATPTVLGLNAATNLVTKGWTISKN